MHLRRFERIYTQCFYVLSCAFVLRYSNITKQLSTISGITSELVANLKSRSSSDHSHDDLVDQVHQC